MGISTKTIERVCRVFEQLVYLEKINVPFVSSGELAEKIGATDYTVRKDISLLGVGGSSAAAGGESIGSIGRGSKKGYVVRSLKAEIGAKLHLNKSRKACIVGLGRLGTALLDYAKFQEDGFEIVAGFDCSINKIERIHTNIDVFHTDNLEAIVRERKIELGIITAPAEFAGDIADKLCRAGVRGILNFSNAKIKLPKHIIHMDMDFTSALRFIAARFSMKGDIPL